MMDEQKPIEALIPKTKKHSSSMGHKIDTGKLRDMLREKCRIRVRESRHNKFDVSRQFLENEKQWLKNMLRSELTEFEMDIELEEIILKEIIDEQYQWMVEQYETSNEVLDEPKSMLVMCPICQKFELQFNNHLLHCACGFEQSYSGTLEDFWKTVQKQISDHEEKCSNRLVFFFDANESALNVMCHGCDFLALLE